MSEEKAASELGRFIVFPSHEWHSCRQGDHNVYAMESDLALRDGENLAGLRAAADERYLLVPHHIGYAAGHRGIDWDSFQAECSPFVEVEVTKQLNG